MNFSTGRYMDAEELTGGRVVLAELITELLAKHVLGSMGLARWIAIALKNRVLFLRQMSWSKGIWFHKKASLTNSYEDTETVAGYRSCSLAPSQLKASICLGQARFAPRQAWPKTQDRRDLGYNNKGSLAVLCLLTSSFVLEDWMCRCTHFPITRGKPPAGH